MAHYTPQAIDAYMAGYTGCMLVSADAALAAVLLPESEVREDLVGELAAGRLSPAWGAAGRGRAPALLLMTAAHGEAGTPRPLVDGDSPRTTAV